MGDTYILKTGKPGIEQLDFLDQFMGNHSRCFLQELGLNKGMIIADVGCGIGNLTLWLAEQVGPLGKVVGFDISAEQILVARQRALDRNISNVEFYVNDAYSINNFDSYFDISFARALLIHLKKPDLAIDAMIRITKNRGLIAVEESNLLSRTLFPKLNSFEVSIKKIYDLLVKNGSSPDIAVNLQKLFCQRNLSLFYKSEYKKMTGNCKEINEVVNTKLVNLLKNMGSNLDDVSNIIEQLEIFKASTKSILCYGDVVQLSAIVN